MSLKKLYLFRHGETDWNKNNIIQGGASDIPLNEVGLEQAKELTEAISDKGIQAIISSDLIRALQTAGVIAKKLGVEVFPSPALRETHYGVSEGMKRDEAIQKYADILKRIDNPDDPDRNNVCIPEGETRQQVIDRVTNHIIDFLCKEDYDCVGVSTHGGVLNGLCVVLLGEVLKFKNCEFLSLVFDTETQTFSKSA